ncbi:DUF2934 domain-containing protein [Propionivibrio sp.]|uniref:DUF2934 domain-containing protein n=1 Tax=Propionivibrio sp. TaxID=2212460 RepID=UPI0026098AFB|nr:DUF2934 domain-containing protein [Propionivibrio sp.]
MAETNAKTGPKKAATKAAASVKPAAAAKPVAATKKPVVVKKPVATKAPAAKPAATKAPAAKPAARSPSKAKVLSDEQRYRMVAEAAYYRAERNQFQSDPLRDWIDAESDISALLNSSK